MSKSARIPKTEANDTIAPWRNRKVQVRIVLVFAALFLATLIGLYIVYPRVVKWRDGRSLLLAGQYLANEDFRSAYLLLEPFVRTNPANFEARRLLARVYEVIQPEQALIEWENLTRVEANNSANLIGYATAALRVGQMDRLPSLLAALHKLEPESVEYHRLAAASALARSDLGKLREHVGRLAQLEPLNPLTRYSLAALQLNATHPAELAQARASLAELARGDALRIQATLALIKDAPRRWADEKNPARVYERLADELRLRGPEAGSTPRYLNIQGHYDQPLAGLPALIEHMEAQPTPTPNDAAMLAQWLLQIGRGRDALYWLDTLAEPLRSSGMVRQSMATCAAVLESWSRLEQLITAGAWGPVPAEAVKLAFTARAFRAERNESKAASQWSSAIRLCDQSLSGLRALQRLAQIWRWPNKQMQVLWVIVRQFPEDEPAWRALAQHAQVEGNSAELWRIYHAWIQAMPSNVEVRAERILVGLLVRPGEIGLGSAAADMFEQHPGLPVCRVAHALSLWRTGQAQEALGLLEADGALDFERHPRFALVRGLALATLGRSAESEKMFTLAPDAQLLPEERALVAQARKPGR